MSRSEPEEGLKISSKSQRFLFFSCNNHLRGTGKARSSLFLSIPPTSSPASLREKCQWGRISVTRICHRVGFFPSFLRTEKLFFTLSWLFVVQACGPGYLWWSEGTWSLAWIRVPTVSKKHPRWSLMCLPNQLCVHSQASEIDTEESGPSQVWQAYNVTMLATTHWESQLFSVLIAKPWVILAYPFITHIVSIGVSFMCCQHQPQAPHRLI